MQRQETSRPRFRRVDFGPIVVEYDDRVLEPRPWTVEQATWAADLATSVSSGEILELYCGAGHIGLAAARLSGRTLVQVDDNAHACAWAAHNAVQLSIESDVRCAAAARALRAHEQFPIVIADPPYLRSDQVDHFPEDPIHAVDGGIDGLVEIEVALQLMSTHTTRDGAALLQVRGPRQARAISVLLADSRIAMEVTDIRTITDERSIVLLSPDLKVK